MRQRAGEFATTLLRAVRMVWRSGRALTVSHIALTTVLALAPLVSLWILKRAIDSAGAALISLTLEEGQGVMALWQTHRPEVIGVAGWFLAGGVLMALTMMLRVMASWVREVHAVAVSDHIHETLHGKLLSVDLDFFENTDEQDRLHLAQQQALTRPSHVLDGLAQLLRAVVGLGGVVLLLATFDWRLPLLLLLVGLPAMLVRIDRTRRLYRRREQLAPIERETGYFHHLISSVGYAKETRVFRHGAALRQRFRDLRRHLRHEHLQWRRFVLRRELGLQAIGLLTTVGVLLWLVVRLLLRRLTVGSLVMYAQAAQRAQGHLNGTINAVTGLFEDALFLKAFDDLLAHPPNVSRPQRPRTPPAQIRQGIRFENVDFVYPGTERRVLQNVSFELPVGRCCALAGPNGSGKTTILKLLCRLYDPTAGRILVDGVDLREFDPVAWRQRLGVLFQDFGQYQLTARENVELVPDEQDDQQIRQAIDRVGLNRVINALPDGLDTQLGRWLHKGAEPSTGQWQRFALARALHGDQPVLLLDEPTSALDAEAQDQALELFRELAQSRVLMMVSHRRELLSRADVVIDVTAPAAQ